MHINPKNCKNLIQPYQTQCPLANKLRFFDYILSYNKYLCRYIALVWLLLKYYYIKFLLIKRYIKDIIYRQNSININVILSLYKFFLIHCYLMCNICLIWYLRQNYTIVSSRTLVDKFRCVCDIN